MSGARVLWQRPSDPEAQTAIEVAAQFLAPMAQVAQAAEAWMQAEERPGADVVGGLGLALCADGVREFLPMVRQLGEQGKSLNDARERFVAIVEAARYGEPTEGKPPPDLARTARRVADTARHLAALIESCAMRLAADAAAAERGACALLTGEALVDGDRIVSIARTPAAADGAGREG